MSKRRLIAITAIVFINVGSFAVANATSNAAALNIWDIVSSSLMSGDVTAEYARVISVDDPGVAPEVSSSVVISQVYGGGGNTGTPYIHDFVEVLDRSTGPISLNGMSIQYTSAAGQLDSDLWAITGRNGAEVSSSRDKSQFELSGQRTKAGSGIGFGQSADLQLNMSDSPDPVVVGSLLTYTLTVGNAGPSTILPTDTFSIVESLPPGLSGCSYTPAAGAFSVGTIAPGSTGTGTWTGATIAPAGSITLTISCTVSASAAATISNTGTVVPPAGVLDPDCSGSPVVCSGNNTASVTTTVNRPQLTMAKTASTSTFTVGVPVSYTLVVQNTGTAATTAASTITDTIPAGLTIGTLPAGCTSAGQTVTCTFASGLAAGANSLFVIPVMPTAAAAPSVTNTATASGGGDVTCPGAARCTSSVGPITVNPSAPVVATNAATSITDSGATLNGSANPNGAATGWFRYSTVSPGTCNDSFGTRAPSTGGTSLGSGTSSVPYSFGITGLVAGTQYFFCAIAQNSQGTSFGAVQQFTTTAPPPAVQFSASSYMDDESQSAVITVTRTGDLSGTSSVDVVLSGGTATGGADCTTSGVDYVYTGPVTLNFAINDDSESFSVPLCGDVINEGTETVNLSLTNNVNADIGSPSTAVLSINDTASQFRNATAIDMFLGTAGSPNPSTINVTGGPTVIGSMRVTLYDLSHDIPDNIDILLVGPNGAKYVLMGDTGGPFTIDVNSPVTLSFTDSAGMVLPDSDPLTTGTYLPTTCETPVTNFAGAPAGPYVEPGCVVSRPVTQSMFGAFGLTSPMGNWSLYVRDDNGSPLTMTAIGSIAGGWGIEFLPPTAAGVEVSGRVLTPDGRGLRNATITMTDAAGITRNAVTSSFGYYRFEGVTVGESFVMSVNSRSYRFVPRVVNVLDNMTDVDFVGIE